MQAAACIANGPLPMADREASFDGDSEIEVQVSNVLSDLNL
jgi:hypothetical protein